MKTNLEDDNYCFICGEKNPFGLKLRFSLHEGRATVEFTPEKPHQGYKDIVHGGIISALIDEAMVKALLLQGIPAITAEINVRFKNPLLIGESVLVEGTVIKINRRIAETYGTVRKSDGTLIAEGNAKLLRQD
ncbi:MAG: PaaI family thioesterase [Nitrospirota bacterium]